MRSVKRIAQALSHTRRRIVFVEEQIAKGTTDPSVPRGAMRRRLRSLRRQEAQIEGVLSDISDGAVTHPKIVDGLAKKLEKLL